MRFGSALSRDPDTVTALAQALADATDGLDVDPNFVLAFMSPEHAPQIAHVAGVLRTMVPDGITAGCVAQGVIGESEDAETGPGLVIWAAALHGIDLAVRHVEATRVPERGIVVSPAAEVDDMGGAILLADPMSFPTTVFVERLGESGIPVVGGLAYAGAETRLFARGEIHDHGAVMIAVGAGVEFRPLLSHGCRPLGEPAVVTAVDKRELVELAGEPALDYLRHLFASLDERDRDLARTGLHIGVVRDEYQADHGQGDFLIRAVTAIDQEHGTISVGDRIPVGRTVQFQVRDPESADEHLRRVLHGSEATGGVLLFNCNGRGEGFFGRRHHDVELVSELLQPAALGGFFAAGEIGPVDGGNYVHGYTACMVEMRLSDD